MDSIINVTFRFQFQHPDDNSLVRVTYLQIALFFYLVTASKHYKMSILKGTISTPAQDRAQCQIHLSFHLCNNLLA